jgi:anti-sigma regulatory factor (Ser/Thr protein kinase)
MHAWLADNGVDPDDAFDILVATSEACSNVVAHAYGLTPGPLELRACLEDSELAIIVKDSGTWSACGVGGDSGGRGLQMIRTLMHNVEIVTDNGTEIRMRRTLHSPARPGPASHE